MVFEFGHVHSGSVVYAQPSDHWLDMPVNETLILNNIIICYIFKFTDKQTFVTWSSLFQWKMSLLCDCVHFWSRLLHWVSFINASHFQWFMFLFIVYSSVYTKLSLTSAKHISMLPRLSITNSYTWASNLIDCKIYTISLGIAKLIYKAFIP